MRSIVKKAALCVSIPVLLWSCEKEPIDSDPLLSFPPVQIAHISSIVQFGEDLGAGKESPAFEYILLEPFQPVLAVEEGTVKAVVKNEGFNDYEVRIQLNSSWMIIYDHLVNPSVSKGDNVSPGQLLGAIGDGNRFELQINNKDGKSYCPFGYASQSFVDAHKNFTENWCMKETVVND